MLNLLDILRADNQTKYAGKWIPAKPEPYYHWWHRLKDAWEVFRYRAEAIKWPEEK